MEKYLGDGVQYITQKAKKDQSDPMKLKILSAQASLPSNNTIEFFKELIDYEKREKDALRITCDELKKKIDYMSNCERELEKLSEEHENFLQKFSRFEETYNFMKTVNEKLINSFQNFKIKKGSRSGKV